MRQRIAARATTPWWYPPLYGLGCGGMVASISLPLPLIAPGVVACSLVIVAGYVVWSRSSGLSVNGYRRGRTLPITIAVVAAFVLLGLAAMLLRFQAGIGWAPLACGAVLAVVAGLGSAAWDRAWRADILSAA
jgi:hypothetical protein